MEKQEAINLLPLPYSDLRGKTFVAIAWEETQTGNFIWGAEDDAYVLRVIQAFVPTIAPFAARLSLAQRRVFLRELPGLIRLAGTNYSILRTLEIFGYTAELVENPDGAFGTFRVRIVQSFDLAEVSAIVNYFKPVGRILSSIQSFTAILLDGTNLFNGSTTLA
jgi:hypothetical protein